MEPYGSYTTEEKPLQMAREPEGPRKVLLNWPPAEEYHQVEFKPKRSYRWVVFLSMMAITGYFYMKYHM